MDALISRAIRLAEWGGVGGPGRAVAGMLRELRRGLARGARMPETALERRGLQRGLGCGLGVA